MAAPPDEVLAGKRTPGGGWALVLIGSGVAVTGLWHAIFGGEAPSHALLLLGVALPFGAVLARAGQLLLLEKGGIDFLPDTRTLRLRCAGDGDSLSVAATSLSGVRLVPRDEVWGQEPVRNWSCELQRRGGCPVAVAESTDYDAIWSLARGIETRLGIPLREHADWGAAGESVEDAAGRPRSAREGRRSVVAGRAGRVAETLATFGVLATLVGGLMFSQVATAPVFGFLFGPTLLLLGTALLGVVIVGRWSSDEIAWLPSEIAHRTRLGGLGWGRKALARGGDGGQPYVRLHHRGLLGVSLEAVGPSQTVVLVGAVTGSSRLGFDGLLALADEIYATLD